VQITFEQVDSKTWRSEFLRVVDMGRIDGGVTHRYELTGSDGTVLGWIVWRAPWRRYVYKPVTGWDTFYDSLCLTIIAEFVRLRTDERKAQWGPQGRFADR
jgi:hypothetical protein